MAAISFDDLIPQTPPGFQDVRAPDGSIARFAAAMSDDAIEAVMRQHYPAAGTPQPTGGGSPISFDDLIPKQGADPYASFSSPVSSVVKAQGTTGPGTAPYSASDPYAAFSSPVAPSQQGAPPAPPAWAQSATPPAWAQAPVPAAARPNPFDQFDPPQQKAAPNPFDQFDAAAPAPRSAAPQPHRYSILPISEDAQGNPHFDSNAGLLGAIKSALSLPGDVYTGKVDPLSDQGIDRAAGMAGLVTPANNFGSTIAGGVRSVMPAAAVPTADALRDAASAGYDQVRNMGVNYAPDAVGQMASGIQSDLNGDGILSQLAPQTHAILDNLQNVPAGSVAPLASLEAARRALGNAAKNFTNPTEQLAAKRAQQGLEDFVSNPAPGSVVSGPAEDAAEALANARGNYAAAMRSDKLTGVADAADLRAAAANSGMNLDNSIRQRVVSILNSPKQSAGFSPDELAALNQVARGTAPRNVLRWVGNLFGGGGGLGAVASGGVSGAIGDAAGGPILGAIAGAGVPAAGFAAKQLANALASKSLSAADELVRQRSPLYGDMQRARVPLRVAPTNASALARALMGSAGGGTANP